MYGRLEGGTPLAIRTGKCSVDAMTSVGKKVSDTTDKLRAETDNEAKVACIGPSGEKLALFACIINEMHRVAEMEKTGAL